MDFTFDNPFDDVFTDPQAAQQTPGAQDAPAAAVVAEVPPTPVAIEPVQQQPTTFVQPTQTNATTAPVTANPAQASPATHSATIPAQNPAITSPQMFTPLVTPAQPTAVQPVAPVAQTAPADTGAVVAQPLANSAFANGLLGQQPIQLQQPTQFIPPTTTSPILVAPTTVGAGPSPASATTPATAAPAAEAAVNPNDIWRETKAATGRIYYYKKSTRETTWTKPAIYIPVGGSGPVNGTTGEPVSLSMLAAPAATSPAATPETSNATPTAVASPATPEPSVQQQQPATVAAPAAVVSTPATTAAPYTAPSTQPNNTPLTGFQLSGLSGTTPTTNPLATSPSHDNPGLLASGSLSNSASTPLYGGSQSNPALNPALAMNPALMTPQQPQNPALANPALGGAPATQNPALVNPALGGTNPALVGANTATTGAANPALNASNPALGGSNASLSNSSSSIAATGIVASPSSNDVSAGPSGQQPSSDGSSASHTPRDPSADPAVADATAAVANATIEEPAPPAEPAAPAEPTFDPTAHGMVQDAATGIWYNPMTGVQYDASSGTQYDPTTANYSHVGFAPAGSPAFVQIGVPYDPSLANSTGQGVFDPNLKAYVYPAPPEPTSLASSSSSNAAATPAAATPAPFPKMLRVRLPADQRQVVSFKPELTLRSVLAKICASRGLSIDDYLAKDRSGMDINLDRTLGDINQEEISFMTPRAGIVPQDETKRKAHKLMSDIYEANAGLSSSLQAIIKNYRDPLLKSAQDTDIRKRLLSEQDCNQIFASIESITSMTKEFMTHLSKQLSSWPVDLTDMVTRHTEVLTFYHEFVNNYRQNMNKLEDLRRNPDFSAFVDGVQRSLGSRLKLEDFLALPAVKIAATNVLIDQLITVLTDQHPNYFMLREFQQRLAPIANQATALRLQMEARSKIVWLEANIAKFPKQKGLFLHDQRIFFRDGVFEIGTKKKPALCYVALFTDLMIICKAPEKKKKDKAATPPTFEEVIAFGPTGCTVEEVGSQGWNLHIDAGRGKFTATCLIHTSSESTKADWVKSFKDAFHDFSGKPHLKPPVL